MVPPPHTDDSIASLEPVPIAFVTPDWPVLYLDNHLLGLYKPAGVPVQGDRSGDPALLDLAKAWLKERCRKPGRVYLGLVHRLDRPVAGVVLFARTSKAAGRISEQFRNRTVAKQYLAVVAGRPPEDAGRLLHHLERGNFTSSRITAQPTAGSREARLSYRVLGRTEGTSLVQVQLETGRKHQIRLQLAAAGCPILGDLRYGAATPLPQRQIALLAWKLAIDHPIGGRRLQLTSPIPRGWPWPAADSAAPAPPWNWSDIVPILAGRGALIACETDGCIAPGEK